MRVETFNHSYIQVTKLLCNDVQRYTRHRSMTSIRMAKCVKSHSWINTRPSRGFMKFAVMSLGPPSFAIVSDKH